MINYLIGLLCMSISWSLIGQDRLNPEIYQQSYNIWQEEKIACRNSYVMVIASEIPGLEAKTTLIVQNGQVVERSYRAVPSDSNQLEQALFWREKGKDIGTHLEGAGVVTLDQIYEYAAQNYVYIKPGANFYAPKEQNPQLPQAIGPKYHVRFETDTRGLIRIVGQEYNNCTGSYFYGYKIEAIEYLDIKD